jgi:hypothetical protein
VYKFNIINKFDTVYCTLSCILSYLPNSYSSPPNSNYPFQVQVIGHNFISKQSAMKSKSAAFILFLMLNYLQIDAQLQLVSTTGDRLTGQTMTLNFSIGEVAVGTIMSNQQKLTQGIYQPDYISTSTEEFQAGQIQFYPNPVDQTLFIQLDREFQANHEFEVVLYDIIGKVINHQLLSAANGGYHRLDLGSYPSGVYLLHLQSRDKAIIATHKIIKQ